MGRTKAVSSDEVDRARKIAREEFEEKLHNKFPDPDDKERKRVETMMDDWWPMEDDDG